MLLIAAIFPEALGRTDCNIFTRVLFVFSWLEGGSNLRIMVSPVRSHHLVLIWRWVEILCIQYVETTTFKLFPDFDIFWYWTIQFSDAQSKVGSGGRRCLRYVRKLLGTARRRQRTLQLRSASLCIGRQFCVGWCVSRKRSYLLLLWFYTGWQLFPALELVCARRKRTSMPLQVVQ